MNTFPPPATFDVNLKFDECVVQRIGAFQRVYGLVKVRQLVALIESVDLDSNPRNSKAGSITADIAESLERYPETFPLMTKGILISATNFRGLERNRYQLRFEDKSVEGVIDGGHNLLAVGLFVLGEALSEASVKERIGARVIFSQFKSLFKQHYSEIESFLQDAKNDAILDRFVPLELLLPASDSDADRLAFREALPLIQQARNNNAQLKNQTLADHAGIFEELKNAIDPTLRALIEWKTNDGGVVDVRDLIALAWIPLSELDFDVVDRAGKRITPPSSPQLYSSKATVLNRYVEFMESDDVGRAPAGGKYELRKEEVRQALELTSGLPSLFEQVSEILEPMFNHVAPKTKFADLTVVETANKRKDIEHKFSRTRAPLAVPDGFVWPVITGFRALIRRDSEGSLAWGVDPFVFLHDHWQELADSFYTILENGQFDPQKVGKSKLSYDLFYAKIDSIFQRVK
jgi:hypothetical protein